jgi:hypothetical protein
MNALYVNAALYTIGWILSVLAQAQNSVLSKSNGLPPGWPGIWRYIQLQAINLAIRALISGALYGFVIGKIGNELQGVGLNLHGAAVAALSGLAANYVIYQAAGLLPWFRKEIADLVPPANSQIVAPPAPPAPPPSETRS